MCVEQIDVCHMPGGGHHGEGRGTLGEHGASFVEHGGVRPLSDQQRPYVYDADPADDSEGEDECVHGHGVSHHEQPPAVVDQYDQFVPLFSRAQTSRLVYLGGVFWIVAAVCFLGAIAIDVAAVGKAATTSID